MGSSVKGLLRTGGVLVLTFAALNILAAGLAVTARGGLGVVEPPVKREPPESMAA